MGFGTKTYWLTDRQSQCDFDFCYIYIHLITCKIHIIHTDKWRITTDWVWQRTDPSSPQRERPTSTNPQISDSNKDLVLSPRWVLYFKTDWPTDRRLQHNFDFDSNQGERERERERENGASRQQSRKKVSAEDWLWLGLIVKEAVNNVTVQCKTRYY
jgi:hypothetical protein